MQRNIFYNVKANGSKGTTIHIVQQQTSKQPSQYTNALCGYLPANGKKVFDYGWDFISDVMLVDGTKVCATCQKLMIKRLREMYLSK